jgi:hypothetical protein
MKLHSDILNRDSINRAMDNAKAAGDVARHVHFYIFEESRSRKRANGFEIQLGTYTKVPGDKRGHKNSGNGGASSVYAATYDEWGWFIAELFRMDPDAIFGNYKGLKDFDGQTRFQYGY